MFPGFGIDPLQRDQRAKLKKEILCKPVAARGDRGILDIQGGAIHERQKEKRLAGVAASRRYS
jgi:hypothetical protein